jgi:DNA-directed RNA polymerase
LIQDEHTLREVFFPKHLPMIVKPKPWVSSMEGGYLELKECIMRTKGSKIQKELISNTHTIEIYKGNFYIYLIIFYY